MRADLLRWACSVALCLASSGCATLTQGGSQKLAVTSEPSGAVVSVNGVDHGSTPVVLSLRRGSSHAVQVRADGYEPETAVLLTRPDYRRVLLNLLLVHPAIAGFGVGVDLVTGSHHRIVPDAVAFDLSRGEVRPGEPEGPGPQPWQPAPAGSRVRVWSAETAAPVVVGTVVSVTGDTLLVRTARSGSNLPIARPSIAALDLGVGRDRPGGALRGAGWGALAGLAVGFGVGSLAFGAEGGWYIGTLYGAPAGVLVGAGVGATVAPKERWLRVPAPAR